MPLLPLTLCRHCRSLAHAPQGLSDWNEPVKRGPSRQQPVETASQLDRQIRFDLRTLLIASTLVGTFLGLQAHVHIKANRFANTMLSPSVEDQKRLVLDAELDPTKNFFWVDADGEVWVQGEHEYPTITDFVLARRTVRVTFLTSYPTNTYNDAKKCVHRYHIYAFGTYCKSNWNDHLSK